jgi:hypothetical protein
MEERTNIGTSYDYDAEFDELDEIVMRDVDPKSFYLGDPRYGVVGNADEQWAFVHSIKIVERERFKQMNFTAGLMDGEGFCVLNTESKGGVIEFKGKRIVLSGQDISFIIGYRLSIAKSMVNVSDAMYSCAKNVLSLSCFNDFFLMVDWQKINFYSLFEIVKD